MTSDIKSNIYDKEAVEVEVKTPILQPFFRELRNAFRLPKITYEVESIYPEGLYVFTAGLTGVFFTANRSLVAKTFIPLIFTCTAFSMFLPKTTNNILEHWGMLNLKNGVGEKINSLKDSIRIP
jgi:hypothetical protein